MKLDYKICRKDLMKFKWIKVREDSKYCENKHIIDVWKYTPISNSELEYIHSRTWKVGDKITEKEETEGTTFNMVKALQRINTAALYQDDTMNGNLKYSATCAINTRK